jgi:hypothetical protein
MEGYVYFIDNVQCGNRFSVTANREIFVLCTFHCLLRFNFVMSEIKRIYELKQVVCLFYVELLSFCPSLLNLSDT